MENQIQMARDSHRRSIEEAQELWQEARASIANRELCPLYDGLKIQPQEGLVPLARNEKTGLWSFRHLPTQGASSKDTAVSATTFVLIPGGTFRMGAIPAPTPGPNIDTAAGIDEAPIRSITLSPFFISSVEITQSRWQEVMNSNPSYYPAGSLRGRVVTWENPVENITHAEAAEYCRRIGLQLPTEAQWEYVARAGTSTVWPTGDDKNSLQGSINIADQAARAGGATWPEIDEWPGFSGGHAIHAPAGSFRPNAFGIFDMQGNVWEWCRDGYTPYNNTPEPEDGLRLRARSTNFVMRGGSFRNSVGRTRCAHRGSIGSSIRNGNIGFRAIRRLQN
jgi:formylglycine-generating enzyme required for sulfatase activity